MKQIGLVTLVSVIASAAAPLAPRAHAATLHATQKSVAQFGTCFITAQDRAALAWSFVPKSRGGTFSNAGARAASGLYFLAVADRGSERILRLEPTSAGSSVNARVVQAVNQCV